MSLGAAQRVTQFELHKVAVNGSVPSPDVPDVRKTPFIVVGPACPPYFLSSCLRLYIPCVAPLRIKAS